MLKILVAGGAGYIGTHTSVGLLDAGYQVVIVDSLANSRIENVHRIQQITNKTVGFVKADIRDRKLMNEVFSEHQFDAVINFAGFKAVGDSVRYPLDYYDNNLNCAVSLLECMCANKVKIMVFSSSATVYGEPDELPVTEKAGLAPQNPYGRTKQVIEQMHVDMWSSDNSLKIANLRYFNPVGAHPSGLIGEQPIGQPNNLMPMVAKVAAGELEKLNVFGGDYDTPDGTAIRDYIHVMDLGWGHVKALQKLSRLEQGKLVTINLGTGRGYSVLEVVKTFEQVSGQKIPFEIIDRREGDIACCFADPGLAKQEIEWESELGINDMCKDAWNWQMQLGR